MSDCHNYAANYSRRDFLGRTSLGLGAAALGSLLGDVASASSDPGLAAAAARFAPRAKRVIFLFQSGAPSQMDLFDFKPKLHELNGQELPPSVRGEQRLTGMTSGQTSLPLAGSAFNFSQHGASGAWVSELLPYTAKIVDRLCFVHSLQTDAINHDPATTFFQTGSQQPGRPAIGAWLSYGIGSENHNLPAFIVLLTKGKTGQPLYARLWGNGFLPSQQQGVQFRAGKDAVLYLSNPDGVDRQARGLEMETLRQLQNRKFHEWDDPDILARLAQYEMAYRMQMSVPEVTDVSNEPESTFELYGADSRQPGTYAANCLLARRLAERGVRFIQIYHRGWDQHSNLPAEIRTQCVETDQASAALVLDLEQRGLLDDTLVIWGGEFGRTCYSQGRLTATNYGRDHHPRCFTMWMAGGGVQRGQAYGRTDDFSYNIVENPVHVHDFQATLLYMLGLDHKRLTFKYQGRQFRLTDVYGRVVDDLLA